MTPRQVRGHIENVNRYVDTMVKTINAKQTKPDRKQKLNEVYPELRSYQEYLHYYISERDKAPTGSGLKKRSSNKKQCKVQILGNPEEIFNKVKLNIASIKAGNTNNNLKTETIKMLDYLYTNKHLTSQAYKLLNNSIHQ